MTHGVCGFFDLLFLPVQKAQIALPGNSKDAGKHESILRRDKPKAKRRDSRPQLERIHNADGHRGRDPVYSSHGSFSCEDGLHAEEVTVEDGREDSLVDCNLGGDRGNFGGVIEVPTEEEKPVFLHVSQYLLR